MTTKDTKTTKNGLGFPPDSSIHQGICELQSLAYTKPAGIKTCRLIHFNWTRPDRIKRFLL